MPAIFGVIFSFLKSSFASLLFKYILSIFTKKQKEKEELEKREKDLEKGVKASANYAGKESEALASAMEHDEQIIEAQREASLQWLKGPVLKVQSKVERGVTFQIVVENVPTGTPVYADKKWKLGVTSANGSLSTKLITLGKRSIDVLAQDDPDDAKKVWVSFDIEVIDVVPV